MGFWSTFRHLFHPQRSNNHRPRVLHPEAYVFFAILAIFFSVALTIIPRFSQTAEKILGFNSSIAPAEVIAQTNVERQKLNLPPLEISQVLTQAAQAKGEDMLAQQYWAHTAPDGTQPWIFFKKFHYNYNIAGENLARDFSDTHEMVNAWMNSRTHRENILNPQYKEIGISVITGTLNGVETTLVVQFFGTPTQSVPQVSPQAISQQVRQIAAKVDVSPEVLSFAEGQLKEASRPLTETINSTAEVLAGTSLKISNLQTPPLFSPLQLTKAFFLAIIFVVVSTLIYDMLIMYHRQTLRMVGKNAAHILFFLFISFLVVFFKSGMIG